MVGGKGRIIKRKKTCIGWMRVAVLYPNYYTNREENPFKTDDGNDGGWYGIWYINELIKWK